MRVVKSPEGGAGQVWLALQRGEPAMPGGFSRGVSAMETIREATSLLEPKQRISHTDLSTQPGVVLCCVGLQG